MLLNGRQSGGIFSNRGAAGMNHWKETAEILSRLAELGAAGRRAALATVVEIVGSAYRRPGAKFLIEDTGSTLGSVSGGCLEADVREVAKAVVETGTPSLRHYNTGDEDVVWGLGLGCNGLVDVFVQPATAGPLAALAGPLRELFAGDGIVALATVVEGGPAGAAAATAEAAAEAAAAAAMGEIGATLAVDCGAMQAPPQLRGGRTPGREREPGEADGAGGHPPAVEPHTGGHPPAPVHGSLGSAELDREVVERVRGLAAAGRSGVQAIAGRRVFIEVLAPPPHLLVCGGGDDARPLVAYAADVGFRVTLLDHRPALLAPEWFPQALRRVVARPEDPDLALPPPARTLAVVKTHSLAHDREWVRRLLAAGLPYIGVLGPRARTQAILRDVGAEAADGASGAGAGGAGGRCDAGEHRRFAASHGGSAAERVFGPVGLDLGADGPRQVAISIVAELLAFTARREARHLSARQEAIHAG
jgi:xanthine dehydrogenase accessory factor